MLVGIVRSDDLAEADEVGFVLILEGIPLVRERPPDVAMRAQAGDDVAQVAVVVLCAHVVEAPVALVIGMEEDEVGLDAHGARAVRRAARNAGSRPG